MPESVHVLLMDTWSLDSRGLSRRDLVREKSVQNNEESGREKKEPVTSRTAGSQFVP